MKRRDRQMEGKERGKVQVGFVENSLVCAKLALLKTV